jgi:hypothetical protein
MSRLRHSANPLLPIVGGANPLLLRMAALELPSRLRPPPPPAPAPLPAPSAKRPLTLEELVGPELSPADAEGKAALEEAVRFFSGARRFAAPPPAPLQKLTTPPHTHHPYTRADGVPSLL